MSVSRGAQQGELSIGDRLAITHLLIGPGTLGGKEQPSLEH
ncbi:hypothetical protein [Mycobacterium sp. NPDC050853]